MDNADDDKQAWCGCCCLQFLFAKLWQGKTSAKIGDVVFEDFNDFGRSKYSPMISVVQQLALSKAGGAVPLPSKQLELANNKRDKQPRSYHVCKQHMSHM